MDDLKERLRDVEGFAPPDLWKEITSRESRPLPPEPSHGRRIAVALLALAIGAAGFAFLSRAFRFSSRSGPASPGQSEVKPQIAATVQVGQWPGSVAVGEGSVWVLAHEDDPWRDSLIRIDPQTNGVVADIPLENAHSSLAAGAGAVWVGSFDANGPRLLRIDPATNRVVAVIPGVSGPIAVQPNAVWAFTAGGSGDSTTLVRIDPATNEIAARIPIEHSPPAFDIVATEDAVWILLTNEGHAASDVVKVDTRSNQVVPIAPVKVGSIWMAADEQTVWVQSWNEVVGIDTATGQVVAKVPFSTNFRPFAVADGGVWFIGGPEKPSGICRLNSTAC